MSTDPEADIFLPIRGGNPMERQWPQEEKLEDEGEMQEAHHGSTFETHHVRHDSNRLRVPGLLTLDLLAREDMRNREDDGINNLNTLSLSMLPSRERTQRRRHRREPDGFSPRRQTCQRCVAY
ncbi:hypothetical protein GGX14DRAFT_407994 [Mycena pura]|uniref:Uncharacterized protein n=1 Tax=Mycena pura TaxID=153505 RepID=A0AAD6UR43_9AGAR|nr:hypothetical protein GGX14DRAFT_407994 [Mycena pura]